MNPIGISALILTIGEASYTAAFNSLKSQTVPPQDIVVIRNIEPFSRAFNEGVQQIRSPFFIQCDADMVLDDDCISVMQSKVNDRTGMVIGKLYDPIQGVVHGVKLYRTECCLKFPHQNIPHCGRQFRKVLLMNGWEVKILERDNKKAFGTHRLDISDELYLFERYKYLGNKLFLCKEWEEIIQILVNFIQSKHEKIVPMVTAAFTSGFFLEHQQDHLTHYEPSPKYKIWRELHNTQNNKIDPMKQIKKEKFLFQNFLRGYWSGVIRKLQISKEDPQLLISSLLKSFDYEKWFYLIGYCGALMSRSRRSAYYIFYRFIKSLPLLSCIKENLERPDHLKAKVMLIDE